MSAIAAEAKAIEALCIGLLGSVGDFKLPVSLKEILERYTRGFVTFI